jgi:hypothetical protein
LGEALAEAIHSHQVPPPHRNKKPVDDSLQGN